MNGSRSSKPRKAKRDELDLPSASAKEVDGLRRASRAPLSAAQREAHYWTVRPASYEQLLARGITEGEPFRLDGLDELSGERAGNTDRTGRSEPPDSDAG